MGEPVRAWSHLEFDQADRLRRALRISDVGVQEMARELGVERNTVSRYINGHTRAGRATLLVWAMKTGVPIEWLETGTVPMNGESPRQAVPGGGSTFLEFEGVRHQGLEPRTRWLRTDPPAARVVIPLPSRTSHRGRSGDPMPGAVAVVLPFRRTA